MNKKQFKEVIQPYLDDIKRWEECEWMDSIQLQMLIDYYVNNKTYGKIAEEHNFSSETVRQKIASTLENICEWMEECYEKNNGKLVLKPTNRESHILVLGLEPRTYKALRNHGIKYIKDFQDYTLYNVKYIRNFGKRCMDDLMTKLSKKGFDPDEVFKSEKVKIPYKEYIKKKKAFARQKSKGVEETAASQEQGKLLERNFPIDILEDYERKMILWKKKGKTYTQIVHLLAKDGVKLSIPTVKRFFKCTKI